MKEVYRARVSPWAYESLVPIPKPLANLKDVIIVELPSSDQRWKQLKILDETSGRLLTIMLG